MRTPETIVRDVEEEQIEKGKKLAELLDLKIKENGRYDTTWGDKTPLGLFLTVQRIIES